MSKVLENVCTFFILKSWLHKARLICWGMIWLNLNFFMGEVPII